MLTRFCSCARAFRTAALQCAIAAALLAVYPIVAPAQPAGHGTQGLAPIASENPTAFNRSDRPSDADNVEELSRSIVDSGFLRESAVRFSVMGRPPDSNDATGSDRVARAVEMIDIMQSERSNTSGETLLIAGALVSSLVGGFVAIKIWRKRLIKHARKGHNNAEARYVRRRSRRRRRHKRSSEPSARQPAR
jgi:hypothetical protein